MRKLDFLGPVLSWRRSQAYLAEKFQPFSTNQNLLVPKHVPQHIGLYFQYVANHLSEALKATPRESGKVALGFAKHSLHVPKSLYFILLQHEQTHVLQSAIETLMGGGDLGEDPAIKEIRDGVRLHGGIESFERANGIVEYSFPNLRNVLNSGLSHLYADKAHYVAPILQPHAASPSMRKKPVVSSMFGSPGLGRRGALLEALNLSGVEVSNLSNFSDFGVAFADTGILINASQTSIFCTPEEMRILPALLQRVLVITEDNKAMKDLPYSDFLLATDFSNFSDRVLEAQKHYAETWSRIFGAKGPAGRSFVEMIGLMVESNKKSISRVLRVP